MTDAAKPLPPSRAHSVALVAGDLALDFANSESGRGSASHQDHLQTAVNVADWLGHAAALDSADAANLRARVAADPGFGAELLAAARRLRDGVHAVAAAIAHRSPPPRAALDDLAAQHARWLSAARLELADGQPGWRWRIDQAPLAAALGPIALAAVNLVVRRDPTRVKECGGLDCGWLFYDETKNNRRRWCEMEVCGNRAKQRRRAARSRPT